MSTRSRRRREAAKRKDGGALTGLRSGFKKATGTGDATPAGKRTPSMLGVILTVLMIVAALALFFYRRG